MAFKIEGFSSLSARDKRFFLKSMAKVGDSSLSNKIRREAYSDTINRGPSINSIMTSEEWQRSFGDACQKHIGKRLMSKIVNSK